MGIPNNQSKTHPTRPSSSFCSSFSFNFVFIKPPLTSCKARNPASALPLELNYAGAARLHWGLFRGAGLLVQVYGLSTCELAIPVAARVHEARIGGCSRDIAIVVGGSTRCLVCRAAPNHA